MADIKDLLKQAKELETKVNEKKEEIKRLKEEKRQIVIDNVQNILCPFVEDFVDPIVEMYHKVTSDNWDIYNKLYGSDKDVYKRDEGAARILIDGRYPRVAILDWVSIYFLVGTSDRYGLLDNLPDARDNFISGWFDLVGDVEKAKELCEELKTVTITMCERMIEIFKQKDTELSETVENIKAEIAGASSISVDEVSTDIKLVLNGKEYVCIPKEK